MVCTERWINKLPLLYDTWTTLPHTVRQYKVLPSCIKNCAKIEKVCSTVFYGRINKSSKCKSEPVPSQPVWPVDRIHSWFRREEACISVFTLWTRKIKTQVFSSQRSLENGEALGGLGHYIWHGNWPNIRSIWAGAQTSVTKIINAIIDDKKRGRLNPNLVM